jgi:hypothetical protein
MGATVTPPRLATASLRERAKIWAILDTKKAKVGVIALALVEVNWLDLPEESTNVIYFPPNSTT